MQECVNFAMQLLDVAHGHLPPHILLSQVHAPLLLVGIPVAESRVEHAQVHQNENEDETLKSARTSHLYN